MKGKQQQMGGQKQQTTQGRPSNNIYQSPGFNRSLTNSSQQTASPLTKYQNQQNRQEHEVIKSRLPKTRPQEPFYKRLGEIEKKAKALDQEREEQLDSYDINDFFEDKKDDAPQQPTLQKQVSYLNDQSTSNDQSRSRTIHNASQQNLPRMPNLPNDYFENADREFKYMSTILNQVMVQQQQNGSISVDLTNILSQYGGVHGDRQERHVQGGSAGKQGISNDEKKDDNVVVIVPEANVTDDVLSYYGIKQNLKDTMLDGTKGMRGMLSKNNQFKAIVEDFFERLDSRGKRIKIRRVHVLQEVLGEIGYPYSTMNFHPLTYITQHDLKARANSLAYAKYKLIKRENARKMAKKKLLLIMTVVKCKAFVTKLKLKVQLRREEKKKQDEEQKLRETRRKRIKESQKFDRLSSMDDSSGVLNQTLGLGGGGESEANSSILRLNSQQNNISSTFGGVLKRNESGNLRRGSINPNAKSHLQSTQTLGVAANQEEKGLNASPSFSQFREPSSSSRNRNEREEYLAAKIKIEKLYDNNN